jgi:peptidoglycan/LPS O-acetylase OafA/YrhL
MFLSAYGLCKKYFNVNFKYFPYLKERLFKIYPAFLFSIVAWLLYIGLTNGGIAHVLEVLNDNWLSLFYKLTFISNFIPGELYTINGPWWFFSLIVQFYILFPLIIRMVKKYGELSLLILAIASIWSLGHLQSLVEFPLTGTVFGHLPELCFGVFLAQRKTFSIPYLIIPLLVFLFSLSNFYQFFWYFSFSLVLVLLLLAFHFLFKISNDYMRRVVVFLGSISMYIFYINGFMRQPWVSKAAAVHEWYFNIGYCLTFITLVVMVAYVMNRLEKNLKDLLNK